MAYSDEIKKELEDKMAHELEEGMLESDVGPYHGIAKSTYFGWKKKFPEFGERMERAVLVYKKKLITIINAGSVKKPEVALEILRRRFPREWNVVQKFGFVDPEEELDKFEKLVYGDVKDKPTLLGEGSEMGEGNIQESQ